MTSRHGGFRGVFDHGGLIRHIEQIFHRILDLVLDAELYVDDVFVAREHTGLFGQGTVRPLLESAALPYGAEAHFHTLDLRDFGLVDGFYGKGQRVMAGRLRPCGRICRSAGQRPLHRD